LTIETDKVSNDLDAEVAGILNVLVQEGEEVAIGTVVGVIEEGDVADAVEAKSDLPVETDPEPQADSEPQAGKEIEIKVPAAGESITSANIGRWYMADKSQVNKGDILGGLRAASG